MRRIRITLTSLLVVTIVGVGVVTRAITRPAGPTTGLTVAAAGIATALSAVLALRMLIVLQRVAELAAAHTD